MNSEIACLRLNFGDHKIIVEEELGPLYQRHAEDRLLVRIQEKGYLWLLEDDQENVGPWLPTITPELLTGEFGAPKSDFNLHFDRYLTL